ncbi:hypothetical protein QJQ45_030120 [Haematococcus lacustris]|nr:hypothetical protein QJQ45_030120 [Haematococcus lacustris]
MSSWLKNWGKPSKEAYAGVEFWQSPDRCGWLTKQGEYIKSWRKRWFVLKQGKIMWFLDDAVTADSVPRGVIDVNKCLSIKGAEDTINKAYAFEISTHTESMFFIAESEKEKEDWINAVGRAIVKHSRRQVLSMLPPHYCLATELDLSMACWHGRVHVHGTLTHLLEHDRGDYTTGS